MNSTTDNQEIRLKPKKEKLRSAICDSTKFKGYLSPRAWTLCLGAGISKGIVPDWFGLTHNVVNSAFRKNISLKEFSEAVNDSGWSLDSWIQAAANKYFADGKSSSDFKNLLEDELYSVIRSKANGLGLEKYLIQVLSFPKSAPKNRVIEVCDFLEDAFSKSTLFQVGNALIKCAKNNTAPKAVITFNADTLLETYIDLKLRSLHYRGPGPHGHPDYPFVQVTRPTLKSGDKISIIHCHGAISPRISADIKHRDSRDRLIFLEQEYLAMGASQSVWGESEFLFHAHSTKMVFLGLSMSDTNIRKWMNGINLERIRDLSLFGCDEAPNPHHIWIKPEPKSAELEEIYLLSLQHLGVRPGWIKTWQDVESAILNLASAN